jgi:hypothetical protein
MRWLLLTAMLMLMATTPAEAQGRLTKNWRVKVDYLAELQGVAFCRDTGSFYLVKGGLSDLDRIETTAHEAKHMEQYTRFKDCSAFYRFYDTPKGKLEIEAEAFAAGWCVVTKRGVDPISLRAQHIQLLMRHYVPGTQVFEVATVYGRYARCP